MNPLFNQNHLTDSIQESNISIINNTYQNHYIDKNNNYIELLIKKIDKINSVKEDFWCHFVIKLYYLENEPDIEISNLVKQSNVNIKKYDEIINLINVHITEYSYFAKLKSHFDFHYFPRDTQELILHIKNNDSKPLKQLGYKLNEDNLFLWNKEFSVSSKLLCNTDDKDVIYNFKIRRNSRNYFWNIILLNFLIALTSFASFSIEQSNSADRLNLNGMLLLTKVAFKQVNSEVVPNISYLTLLDKYIFTGLGFMFLVILQNCIATMIGSDFELYSIIALGSIFSLYNLIFCSYWFYH